MVQITLSFDSVTEALSVLAKLQPASIPLPEISPAPAPKPARAAKAAQASTPAPEPVAAPAPVIAAPAEAPAPVAAPAPAEPAAESKPATVDYAQLQRAVLALYKVDKSRTQQIALDMGFESFKVMPAERWAEALANVNAALGV